LSRTCPHDSRGPTLAPSNYPPCQSTRCATGRWELS
jgi:hypothetical protein